MNKYLILILLVQSFFIESTPVVKKIDFNNAFLADTSQDVSCVTDFIDDLDGMIECIDKKTEAKSTKKQDIANRLYKLREERLEAEEGGLFCSEQLSEIEKIECEAKEENIRIQAIQDEAGDLGLSMEEYYALQKYNLYMEQFESVSRANSSLSNKDKSFTTELLEAIVGGVVQGATQAIVNDLLDIEPCKDEVKIKTKQTIPGAPKYGTTVRVSTTKCPDPLILK